MRLLLKQTQLSLGILLVCSLPTLGREPVPSLSQGAPNYNGPNHELQCKNAVQSNLRLYGSAGEALEITVPNEDFNCRLGEIGKIIAELDPNWHEVTSIEEISDQLLAEGNETNIKISIEWSLNYLTSLRSQIETLRAMRGASRNLIAKVDELIAHLQKDLVWPNALTMGQAVWPLDVCVSLMDNESDPDYRRVTPVAIQRFNERRTKILADPAVKPFAFYPDWHRLAFSIARLSDGGHFVMRPTDAWCDTDDDPPSSCRFDRSRSDEKACWDSMSPKLKYWNYHSHVLAWNPPQRACVRDRGSFRPEANSGCDDDPNSILSPFFLEDASQVSVKSSGTFETSMHLSGLKEELRSVEALLDKQIETHKGAFGNNAEQFAKIFDAVLPYFEKSVAAAQRRVDQISDGERNYEKKVARQSELTERLRGHDQRLEAIGVGLGVLALEIGERQVTLTAAERQAESNWTTVKRIEDEFTDVKLDCSGATYESCADEVAKERYDAAKYDKRNEANAAVEQAMKTDDLVKGIEQEIAASEGERVNLLVEQSDLMRSRNADASELRTLQDLTVPETGGLETARYELEAAREDLTEMTVTREKAEQLAK